MRSFNSTYTFMIQSLFLTGLICFVLLGSSCEKDVDPNEAINSALDGEWDVTSFREDGVEFMNSSITRFEIEFKKEGPTTGELVWTIFYSNPNVATIPWQGEYTVKNNGTEIDVEFDNVSINTDFDIDLNGDELELDGNVNGYRWDIEADRD